MTAESDWTFACNNSDYGGDTNVTATTHDDNEDYEVYFSYIYRVIYAVGLAGNTFALIVWARSGLKSSPVTYFQAICVADSLVLIMHPLETFHTVHVQGACQLVHVLFLAVQIFTILLVLGLSVERYIELCHPLAAEVLISRRRTIRSIILLAALSLLASTCEAYIWNVDPSLGTCILRHTTSQRFMWTYATLVLAVLFLCPLLLVILFNVMVAKRIKRRRRNSYAFSVKMVPDRHNMNLPVMFISLYLAVCEIVYATVHISQYFVPNPASAGGSRCAQVIHASNKSDMPLTGRWRSYYVDSLPLLIVDVIALTSYAVDLTIFTLCSKTFRRSIRDLFHRYQRRKSLIMGYREPIPY
ncbi:hypothetical protein BaRGS_00010609 [Batillaria attramentaria]|uniref:G-protein coupled receptors family 1 profile domain-containing protein n=1 Tax=Batillaria attramentaria TaxID=370345 RepID=A0ABD0LF76_9CAEN|nr:hypothetical protein BaRGS_011959 [Batillaria attramentaria]